MVQSTVKKEKAQLEANHVRGRQTDGQGSSRGSRSSEGELAVRVLGQDWDENTGYVRGLIHEWTNNATYSL